MPYEQAACWILDSVVDRQSLLSAIHPDIVELAFNRAGHGLAHPDLIQVVHELFQRGDLIATRLVASDPQRQNHFIPKLSELPALLEPETSVWYGMTPQGGVRWEAAYQPRWDDFLRCEPFGTEGWAIAASTAERLNRFLMARDVREVIVAGSIRQDFPCPWQATYWKTLPQGCRIHLRVSGSEIAFSEAESATNWYSDIGRR